MGGVLPPPPKNFSALWASVWSKNKGGRAPPLDPPLELAYAISTVEDANTRPRLSTSRLKLGLVRVLGLKNSPAFDKMERHGMRVMNF